MPADAGSGQFVHLRLHSEYDIHKGAARIDSADNVIDYAAEQNQPALALTDNGSLFGAIKFYNRCRKRGIKPIIGCEVKTDRQNEYYLLLLCMNDAGYVNLNRLLSRMYSENSCALPEWMDADSTEGLIALSGGARGDIGAAIERARLDSAEKIARGWMEKFPERFYIEVWRAHPQDNNRAAAAAELGGRLGLPVCATHPVQCARRQDEEMLNIKLCIAAGQRIFDPHRPQPLSNAPHLLSAAEMQERFSDLPAALDNAGDIAKRCNFSFRLGKTYLPSLQQEGVSAAEQLKREAEDGLAKKLPPAVPEEKRARYAERLEFELGVINKMQYADYFLIVMDFIRWAKNNGIPVGPGRGSGAGSLAAYALDITTLDPLDYDLLFERFLNPERISMPDFDIDFCVNGRDRVIDYVEERYGKDRVSQIVTFGTIGAKSAVRDVGRVRGVAFGYCDRLARMIPATPQITLERALKESPEFAQAHKDEEGKDLIDMALKIEGLPRNIGTHAGGVLIAPRPMEEFCPTYAAADTNTLVSQYDMGDIEKIGLVKFDFLGLRTLTILADAEREIRRQFKPDFSLETLPLDDPVTYTLYSDGNTAGVFQCESAGMRELMEKLKPDRFTDLIALVALYRPGPLNAGMDRSYIARKHGQEEVTYPHEALADVLDDTYGLFIYQEQVMEIARRISGYSLGEADILRRAMGKKDEKQMAGMRQRFIDGSGEMMTKPKSEKLFNDMAQFAEYGFNKSHAAAYALLSYRTAYIKAHYPAIFLSAVMSAEADNTSRVELLVKDARRRGIAILAPDINASAAGFRAVDDKTIRFGLKAIKGIGSGVIQSIDNARGDAPYQNLFDFCRRAAGQVPAAALELLTFAGAFDSLHANRAAVKATLPSAQTQNAAAGSGLFDDVSPADALAEADDWSLRDKLLHEQKAIGFPLSAPYIKIYRQLLPTLPLSHRRLADLTPDSGMVTIAGTFSHLFRRAKQKGSVTFFLRDENDSIEITAPQETGKLLARARIESELLIVRGSARKFGRNTTLSAASVQTLDEFIAARLKKVTIECGEQFAPDALHAMMRKDPRGKHQVLLRCRDGGIAYDITLGSGWGFDDEHYRQLSALAGVRRVQPDFSLSGHE